MGGLLKKILFITFLLLPIIAVLERNAPFALAEDDVDDEAVVDEGPGSEVEETEEEVEDTTAKGSPDVDTVIYFIKPIGDGSELPAGKQVEFMVGFSNNGDRDFVLDNLDASFRYPMDFNFYIQNFTAVQYKRSVKPRQEATITYSFYPAEAFAGRPLGLSVNLAYHNADGEFFTEAVYNQTVNITEVDEGLDGETFFLYIFLLAFAVLLLLAGHHFLSHLGKKKQSESSKNHRTAIETGTDNDLDYDYIPKEYLNQDLRNRTPRTSPRQRKANREGES